jgi:hypothetical protein
MFKISSIALSVVMALGASAQAQAQTQTLVPLSSRQIEPEGQKLYGSV